METKNNGPRIIISGGGTGGHIFPAVSIANAIKETSEGYDVPVVGLAMDPACQTKSEGVPYKNMFALQPSATTQGDIMAAFAVKNGYKTFGILYNQENAYSVSLLAPFVDRLAEENITCLLYTSPSARDS